MSACVFCQKLEDEDGVTWHGNVASFEPLNPVTPGHRLFLSQQHTRDAAQDARLTGRVFAGAADYGASCGGEFNLITSKGSAATQTIQHLHIHYIPRRIGDGLHLPWTEPAAPTQQKVGE